jgi:ABC-type uncharacterized transport system permease subunit
MKLLRFIKLLFSDIACALKEDVCPNVAFFVTLVGIFWMIGAIANLVSSTYSKWILTHVTGPDYGSVNSILMYINIGAFTFMFLVVLALIPLSIYAICVKIKEYWNKA